MLSLNISPYFDDYDEAKKFHKILARPSFAIQAREFTQLQTILQNQVGRFGDHIFKNGAMVIPGQVAYDNGLHYVKLKATFDGFEIDETQFVSYEIQGVTSGAKAEVTLSTPVEGLDPKTLYVKYTDSGPNGYATFIDGETLQRVDNPAIQCAVAGLLSPESFDSTGLASATSVDTGIYYINRYFVVVDAQTIILEKYNNSPSKKIGFQLYEYLVTPDDDSSLTDNAQGSYNYAAPGAHRYKLELILTAFDSDADLPDDFIELQLIENGTVINEIRTTEYNELEKNLARRTFDESGNYTVRPFNVAIKEHLLDPSVNRLKEGKYTAADGGDESKIAIGIEPGKAYVRGFERVKLATTWIDSNKARTTNKNNNSIVNFNIGQYIYITQAFQMPDFSVYDKVDLYDAESTDGNTSGNIIGTAKVRAVSLDHKSATASESVYKLYLFDINLNAGKAWSEVLWISSSDPNATFTCKTTIGGDYADYDLQILEPTKKASIFKMPSQYVKTLKPDGESDTTYTVQRTYQNESVTDNKITLSAGSNNIFNAFTGSNYIIMDLDATTSDTAFVPITSGDVILISGGSSVEITVPAGITNARVILPVTKQISIERTKTRQIGRINTFSTPNTIAGGVDILDRADVTGINSVILDPSGSAIDITDRYTFDSGQRDSLYDLGRIKLNSNATPPNADISVSFNYFSHSTGDYCSIDSYSILDYNDIPAYYSEDVQYDLSDCVDFRPVVDSTGLSFTGTGGAYGEIPIALSNFRSDYEHYLGRYDKLYIDYTGKFNLIEGTPAVSPEPPKSPDDGMVLYEIYMAPYTFYVNEAKLKFIDNKRYTMRDIGSLEKRISNLEYYTSLSLLEKETAQMQIKDDAGLDRFKNGFIVEPFKSHGIGDAINNDYHCSIDNIQEIMRPTFSADSVDLMFSAEDSSNVTKTGPLVTLPYTSTPFISQSLASTTENVNPFAVRVFEGKMSFQPDSDNWYDTEVNGALVVNDDANYEALQFIADNAVGLNDIQWNSWETIWSSSTKSTSTKSSVQVDRSRDHDEEGQVRSVSKSVTTTKTTLGQERTGTQTVASATTINKDLGDRTVGMNYIPYMRSISVLVKVDSMKPNTQVYPFFDDIDVDQYCTPAIRIGISNTIGSFNTLVGSEEEITSSSGGSATILYHSDEEISIVNWSEIGFNSGDTITGQTSSATAILTEDAVLTSASDDNFTDGQGKIALIFEIPSNDDLKFRTGERTFFLSDQVNNTEANQTKASGIFKSVGSLLQQEGTVLSTKTIRFNQEPLSQTRTVTSTSRSTSTSASGWYDPLAQTFLIEEEGGCFITKCDIYFRDKDSSLPVNFQIREVVNGYPGQIVVPYSECTLYPSEINTSDDGSVASTFTMQAPVYLQQGAEYCFVVLSDSFEYNVWIAEIGQNDIISNNIISKQPYNGVLFKSQNASTWTANQQQDLKFVMHKARFQVETSEGSGVSLIGESILKNMDLSLRYLGSNPLETFINSNIIRVHHKDHGFTNDSKVTLSGFSGTFNNIPDSEINGSHVVSNIEIGSYTITVTTTANDSGITGGTYGIASRNVCMDLIRPNISELIVPGTHSSWNIKPTTSKSFSGSQNDYIKATTWSGINIIENNVFSAPMMICSFENETDFLSGEKSLEIQNLISSDNRNISPVLDTNRIAAIAVGNRIDSPTTTSGNFVVTVSAGSNLVSIAQTGHGMATGSVVDVTSTGTIGAISAAEMTGFFPIVRVDDDNYLIEVDPASTPTADSGTVTIVYSTSHYRYIPENISSGGSVGAKYITRKITVEEPAVAVRLMLTAVVMDNSEFEIWYKIQGPYDTSLFTDLPWQQLTTPDSFVSLSENINDFKDYEFTKEFAEDEEFTSIAIKIVMKSVDSTRVPIFDNLRVICLGT